MKIAVLSDLHVGRCSRAQDLCPEACVDDKYRSEYNGKEKNYIDQFVAFLKKENIRSDYLLIPGDVTDTAHPMEVKVASEFIETVGKTLGVKKTKIVYVPGNHDLDWNMYDKTDLSGIKWAQRYVALKDHRFIFHKINRHGQRGYDLLSGNFFNLWDFDDLVVLGYNSSVTDTPDDDVHVGDIVSQHLDEMEKLLRRMNLRKRECVKIFLIHHHLKNFPLPKKDERDLSIAKNAESMLKLLRDNNFDFILHGHRHHSFFDAHPGDIPTLCSGSFSANISSQFMGLATNQFHIINIVSRCGGKIYGRINSWSNIVSGWEQSPEIRNYDVVGYDRVFGVSLSDNEVSRQVAELIRRHIKERRSFSWNKTIRANFQQLEFLIENRDEIIKWCKDEVIGNDMFDIFRKNDDDIFFHLEGAN